MKVDQAVNPEKSGSKRKRKLTMTDVAEVAGVSQATVSLVLNNVGGSRVNGETVKKVRAAARKIGYSLARRNPVGAGAIQSIGYIIEDTMTNPMVNIAIEAARQAAWENDCVLLVLPTKGDSELGIAALDILIEQRLAGIIMSSFFTRKISIPQKLRSQRSVLLNCYSSRNSVPTLLPAHYEGAREGVEHLIERGHKRIAMINGPLWLDAYSDRLNGYKTALESAGLPFDPSLVVYGDVRISDGQRGTASLLDRRDAPTAIFCCADQVALGCYEELKSRGLRIPDDMAVLGFDNDPMVQLLEPPLTTIAVPHAAMGKSAVAHLLAMRDGTSEDIINGRVLCDAPLIVRQST